MNFDEYIYCEEHGEYIKPFWSERNKDWFAVCNAEVKNLRNGQIGRGHFLKINDDVEFDRGFQNQIDMDYQVEHQHE